MLTGHVLITGGAGTLGKAIIKRAAKENWPCKITIFSTDAVKHTNVRALYPHVRSVIGDVRDYETLHNVMAGMDLVIHAAATKQIPVGEWNSIDTYHINVDGSANVAMAAMQLAIPKVIAISTDKSCGPANAYGATKYLMEKLWQEYSRLGTATDYHLVRYGNVLESTASVVEIWRKAAQNKQPIQMTDPAMTRFWLSPSQAVDHILYALKLDSGQICIPMMKALSIGKLAEYTLGQDYEIQRIPLRPGEKLNETLLTIEEQWYARSADGYFILDPTTSQPTNYPHGAYSSDKASFFTREELTALLND